LHRSNRRYRHIGPIVQTTNPNPNTNSNPNPTNHTNSTNSKPKPCIIYHSFAQKP